MKFGLYLVRNGIITADELVGALEVQHRRYVPIGQIAIEERLLSAREVFHVLQCQNDPCHSHKLFGEIAMEMGLLTEHELQRLLLLQMERRPKLTDVLILRGILTAEEVKFHQKAFRNHLNRRNTVTKQRIPVGPHKVGRVPKMPAEPGMLDEFEFLALMR